MEERLISVRDLTKIYRVPVRAEGLASSFKSLLRPQFTDIEAVNGISFEISAGEMVGLIGPYRRGQNHDAEDLVWFNAPKRGAMCAWPGLSPGNGKRITYAGSAW
jgi:ABC-2 type transport system ATP-binding protein